MKILKYMLIFIPISFIAKFLNTSDSIMFILSCLSIIPLAGLMGEGTEEISFYSGPKIGGFLNGTFGNATELIISFFALKEGLFDVKYKKTIPKIPKSIGVITSETGAVISDIINVIKRRYPKVNIKLYPVKVQGQQSKYDICEGIKFFNKEKNVDTIIVGRGGGSIEELWSFNEEMVAREVFNSKIPIISAVGHETDTTLTDYAADMRAPTPSAAAELAVYSYRDLMMELRESARQLQQSIYHLIKLKKILLTRYEMALSHSSPQDQIRQRRLYLADSEERLKRLLEQKLTSAKHQMALYAEELKGLSPLYKLQGGYAYVADDAGNNIKSIDQLKKGQRLTLTLKDGQADVVVQDVASKR